MAGIARPVQGGTYSGPRSEPGGQNTPRAGRVVASYGAYGPQTGQFAQQIDQGLIFDDAADVTAIVTASGSGVESYVYIDACSGTITASGSGSESATYSESGNATATSGSPRSGVHWSENFEDGDMAGWNAPDVLSGTFTATNDAAIGHDGGRALHIISDATGSGLRRYQDNSWTNTDTLIRFWFRVNAMSTNTAVLQARDDSGGTVWAFAYDVLTSHIEVAIFKESGFVTFLAQPNGTLAMNTWTYVEIRMKAEVAGQASLTQDNGTPITYSGDLSRNIPIKQLQFWAEYANQNAVFDDLQLVHDPDATSVVETSTYTDTGTGTVTAGNSVYANAVMTDSPALYWRLGEAAGASIIKDSSGNGRNATLPGTGVTLGVPSLLPGDPDTAMLSTNTVEGPGAYAIMTTGTYTFEGWAMRQGTAWLGLMASREGGRLLVNQAGIPAFRPRGGISDAAWTNPVAPVGVPFHWACVASATTAELFINGVSQGVLTLPSPGWAAAGGGYVQINNIPDIGPGTGVYDEVAVYEYAVTPARIQAHYVAGTTVVNNDSASGTVTASGTSTEFQSLSYNDSGTAAIIASGTGSRSLSPLIVTVI